MNKKVFSLLLAILLLTTTVFSNVATAQNLPIMKVGTNDGYVGETVSVSVVLEDNPGFSTASVKIDYDSTRLKLLDAKLGDEFASGANVSYDNLPYLTFVKNNDTTTSNFLALTFNILDDASVGDAYITILYDEGDISNKSETDVNFQVVDGKITVKVKPVSATGVTLNKETLSLNTGESETLIATVSPDNTTNKTVSWKSSDTTVATVDNAGKVTAVKKGIATITVTTEDGNFLATCDVSVACSHGNTTVHPANKSTCLVQGNAEYTSCDDCGVVVSGSDAKLPFASHKGGTATCKDKAVCIVCNKAYGEYAGHQLTNHPHDEANHSEVGNIEYWTCDICNKFFNDAAGENEIEQKDTVIDKVSHSYGTEWSYNGTQHWKGCACGAQTELSNHQFDNDCDTTCNAGCGYTRSITHQWKSAYSNDNNKHWYECEICGEKKDEGIHSGGTASCKDKAVCEVCNKAYGELAPHDMKEEVDDIYLKAEANCVAKAVYYKSCSVCGTASTETFKTGELDATIHTGKTDIKDDVKETCTVDGYSGDVYCKDCGAKIKEGEVIPAGHSYDTTYKTDVVNHWKECGCGDTVEKATHTFTEWTVTKEASATEKGSKERTCSVCQYNEVEELPITETNSPQTGDYRTFYLWFALIVVSYVSVVGTIYKRKRI